MRLNIEYIFTIPTTKLSEVQYYLCISIITHTLSTVRYNPKRHSVHIVLGKSLLKTTRSTDDKQCRFSAFCISARSVNARRTPGQRSVSLGSVIVNKEAVIPAAVGYFKGKTEISLVNGKKICDAAR